MYLPTDFKENDLEVLHAAIREHSFGTLVSTGSGGLVASHIPFLLDADRGARGTLLAHLARANGQWRGFADESEVMVIFQGPHGYVSPSWYETELVVPTWNYVAVHAYGRPHIVEDPVVMLKRLVSTYEGQLREPWSMDVLPDEYVHGLLRGIVGFEIPIDRIEGKFKLSQNRTVADQRGAIAGLREMGTRLETEVAELMATRLSERVAND